MCDSITSEMASIAPSLRLGLSTPIVQQVRHRARPWEQAAGPAELVRIAQAADRLGYAWITCSDHVAIPRSHARAMGALWYEPVATLAFLAGQTRQIRLLSHVLVLPYRHPLHVAKAFATLDRLSGGRVILGVGTGHLEPEFRSLGRDFDRRGAEADEAIRAVRAALAGETSSFAGESFAWREMLVAPRAAQQPAPPIWVGGNGARAVRRAAALGDGWIPWEAERARFTALVGMLHALRRDGGGELAIVAPVGLPVATPVSDLPRAIGEWRNAGANAFHLQIESRSLEHFLERLEEVANALA
jgi:probable F420-dependent oxidoreductase